MKFPAGTDGGTISNPQDEGFIRELMSFVGAIEIETGSGHGFILTEKGKLISAYFSSDQGTFRGREALSHMTLDSDGTEEQTFSLRRYNPSEFSLAVRISGEEKLLLSDVPAETLPETPAVPAAAAPSPVNPSDLLDETRLRKIISQPGVIAVSAFFEGFPVQSIGDEDFEHVAASAEDFWRAGLKVAQEMKVGSLDQLILETAQNKFIIAPCGDLYLCILTTADAQLGLIRVVLKSIQKEITGEWRRSIHHIDISGFSGVLMTEIPARFPVQRVDILTGKLSFNGRKSIPETAITGDYTLQRGEIQK